MSDPTGVARLPEIRILGSVSITADGPVELRHIRRLTELGVFLAFTSSAPSPDTVTEAVWPGRHPSGSTRRAVVSRLRGWWGTDSHGQPYLERHTLAVHAWSDWGHMRLLTQWSGGPVDLAAVSTEDLIAALSLVRGRPFSGVQWIEHEWVDPIRSDIEYLVDEVAGEILQRRSGGPAVDLARRVRGLVVPWATAS